MGIEIPTPRAWSNVELRHVLASLPGIRSAINVSGWRDLDKEGKRYRDYFPPECEYRISNYEGDKNRGGSGTDMLSIDLSQQLPEELEGRFDVAFSHTVLEHVAEPGFAFEQIARLSKDIVITIVPFKQKLHFEPGQYGDFYRFTPFSMRSMHERNGLTVLYESFTPRPSLDVYLFYVASKKPEKHPEFPRQLSSINDLNFQVGEFQAKDLAANIISRFYGKYLKKNFQRTRANPDAR